MKRCLRLGVWDHDVVDALCKSSLLLPCDRDSVLFSEGEDTGAVYIVHGPGVTLSISSRDGKQIAIPVETGSLLGWPGILGNGRHVASAKARKGAQVSCLSRERLKHLMAEERWLSIRAIQMLAVEIGDGIEALSGAASLGETASQQAGVTAC